MTSSELQSMHGTYEIADITTSNVKSLILIDQISLEIKYVQKKSFKKSFIHILK